jgi:hypothetical protein
MKALLLTFLLRLSGFIFLLLSSGLYLSAQFIGSNLTMIPVSSGYETFERSGNAMTINYDLSDELFWGVNYQRVLFPVHRGYDTLAGQNLVYASYTLDSLIKSDNSYAVSFGNITGLVLDSMDVRLGHVKYSGTNDTIFLTLVGLDALNFTDGAVAFRDTIVLNTPLSPGNNLTNTVALRWKPNFTMGNSPIGLNIEFVGSLQDTLALEGGYGIYPTPNSCTDSSWDKARKSLFYANSYAYWSNFNLILPTNVGGDIFYNCDTTLTKDTADSESYIQNWSISSYVSAPQIGIEEQEEIQLTIYPNPAGNIVQVKTVVPVTMARVYNSSGIGVKTCASPVNIDVSDLNNGIYIFTFEYENRKVHKKVVIQH